MGRPKSEEKREAILAAATELFLSRGLQGTSMDSVAEQAGVSKQTVYSHFENKEALFRACIEAKVGAYGFGSARLPETGDLRELLRHVLGRFLGLILDDEVVAMYRVVIGESMSHPKIAELFFQSGPYRTIEAVNEFMATLMAQGRLRSDDPEHAAMALLSMGRGHFQMMRLMGMDRDLHAEQVDEHTQRVIDDFIRLYAP